MVTLRRWRILLAGFYFHYGDLPRVEKLRQKTEQPTVGTPFRGKLAPFRGRGNYIGRWDSLPQELDEIGKRCKMEPEVFRQRKEMLTQLMNDKAYVPMKAKEIAVLLGLSQEQKKDLKEVLDSLVAEGVIGISKRGKYGKLEAFSMNGIFTGNARGFGFVTVEGREADIFIPEEKVGQALNGDRVQIV